MTQTIDVVGANVALSGSFSSYSKPEVHFMLRALGAAKVVGSPSKKTVALVCNDAEGSKASKARKLDQPIIAEDSLWTIFPDPFAGFPQRLRQALEDKDWWRYVVRFAAGAGCDDATLARIEARIGFPLSTPARSFFRAVDGLSLVLSTGMERGEGVEPTGDQLAWQLATNDMGEHWQTLYRVQEEREPSETYSGVIVVPPVETMFFGHWSGAEYEGDPKATIKVGRHKWNEAAFYQNLFLLDAFHPYYQTGLYAERENQRLWALLVSDKGASWTDCHPVPFEAYLASLILEYGRYRYFKPTSKTAWRRGFSHVSYRIAPGLDFRID